MPSWERIAAAFAFRLWLICLLSSTPWSSLMDLYQVSQVARQIRRFASHTDEALAWVTDFMRNPVCLTLLS